MVPARRSRLESRSSGPRFTARYSWLGSRPARGSRITDHGSRITAHGLASRSHGSRLTAHDSRLTPHASRLTPHGSRLTPNASRLTPHGSRFTIDASRLTPHASRITDHGSRITDHGSQLAVSRPHGSQLPAPVLIPARLLPAPGGSWLRRSPRLCSPPRLPPPRRALSPPLTHQPKLSASLT